MNTLERIKLSDVFASVREPKYILGTTYTLSLAFFESVLLQYINRSGLLSCLIVCDSVGYERALTEGPALQGAAQDYQVVRAPGTDCFHPKVWIIIGGEETVLLVGSGNLTQAGFVNNAELFDALRISAETPISPQLIDSIRAFVTGLAQMWPNEDSKHLLCTETLGHIRDALSKLPTASTVQEEVRFLHSFRGSLLDQLPDIPSSRELYIASPYFGGSLEGVNLFTRRYPTAKLSIFPAVHEARATDIPLAQLCATYRKARVAPLSLPSKRKGQFAHLKLYGFTTSDEKAWLYCTSANCTKAAWNGPNVEAGLLRMVPRSSIGTYFVPDDAELPHERISCLANGHPEEMLKIWASDNSTRLEIVVAGDNVSRLPLTEVKLTLRAGSYLAIIERATLFREGCSAHVDWSSFPDWHRRKKVTVCLEIEGKSTAGNLVRGGCFVENRLLLTADPVHRSAWRGALILLEEEGAPELADIAAIFSLAQDVFNGTLARMPKSAAPAMGDTSKQALESVAVWPPQPDLRDLQRNIGSTAVGHLQWFHRIFRTFLSNEGTENGSEHSREDEGSGEEGEEDSMAEARRAEEARRAASVAQRIWTKASKDYDQLHERLTALCPSDRNAHNVWPAAVFAFLCIVGIFRAVKRLAPEIDWGIDGTILCDDFLRLMLNERKQDPDFCCPRGFRYRTEKFPSLADDLRDEFKLYPHADLTIVLIAFLTDQIIRSQPPLAPMFVQKRMWQICQPGFQLDAEAIVSCRRIWTRYLWDGGKKTTEVDFTSALQLLPLPKPSSSPS